MGKANHSVNPTDRARRDARRKEIKKNKKQRKIVRGNTLKNKDAKQILDEMYDLDEQEFAISGKNIADENIIKDRKRKLKAVFEKILLFHQRDNKEKYLEIRKWQTDYEIRKRQIWKTYYAKKQEEETKLYENDPLRHILPNIPLPDENPEERAKRTEKSLNKKDVVDLHNIEGARGIPILPANILPPGPPPVAPPPDAIKIPHEMLNSFNSKPPLSSTNLFSIKSDGPGYPSQETFIPPPPPPPPPSLPPFPTAVPNSSYPYMLSNQYSNVYAQDPTYNYCSNVLQNNPHIYPEKNQDEQQINTSTVITATPKLRDMQAEVTKLVPISVLKKRDKKPKKPTPSKPPISSTLTLEQKGISGCPEIADQDVIYKKFMTELDQL